MTVRHFCSWFGCAVLFAVTVACTSPAPDTRDADVKAVRDKEAAWSKDIASRDVDRFVSYYAADASLLLPNMPALTGKDAIRVALKPMLDDPNFSMTFQPTTVEASKGGDFVYTQGTYAQTTSDPKNPKKTISDKGKYLTVWRKQTDGAWTAVADMTNSDLPFAPPSPAKGKASKAPAKSKASHRKSR